MWSILLCQRWCLKTVKTIKTRTLNESRQCTSRCGPNTLKRLEHTQSVDVHLCLAPGPGSPCHIHPARFHRGTVHHFSLGEVPQSQDPRSRGAKSQRAGRAVEMACFNGFWGEHRFWKPVFTPPKLRVSCRFSLKPILGSLHGSIGSEYDVHVCASWKHQRASAEAFKLLKVQLRRGIC